MTLRSILAAGILCGGLVGGLGAQAAPSVPQPGLAADGMFTAARTTKAERMMRRRNTMRQGDPNARNPERPGYKQQLGNTSGGPRY